MYITLWRWSDRNSGDRCDKYTACSKTSIYIRLQFADDHVDQPYTHHKDCVSKWGNYNRFEYACSVVSSPISNALGDELRKEAKIKTGISILNVVTLYCVWHIMCLVLCAVVLCFLRVVHSTQTVLCGCSPRLTVHNDDNYGGRVGTVHDLRLVC